MRAIQLERQASIGKHPLALVERARPQPAPRELLLRVRACGVCRTDLHVIEGDLPPQRLPLIPGHQIVGVVEGRGVDARRFEPGARVGVAWLRWTCGGCEHCLSGRENLCERSRYTGYHADGGYAEYTLVDERWAYALPEVFGDSQAAPLLCAGIIGYRALMRSGVEAGGTLGLVGFGSSAHITLQLAVARGCEVHVATRSASHRRLALELGAGSAGSIEQLEGRGLDGAILFAPTGGLVPPTLRSLRKGGTLAIAGIHLSPVPELAYEPHLFHEKVLTSVESNTRDDAEALLEEAARIRLQPRVEELPLTDAGRALEALAGAGIDGTAVLLP